MAGQPLLHEGRDGLRQAINAVNQLLRRVPAGALVTYPLVINLLTTGPTEIVPAGATYWVTHRVDIALVAVTGAVVVPAQVEFGSNATYDNVAAATVIPAGTLVNEVVPVTLAATPMSLIGPISANVTVAATGVTVYTAECHVSGYWRVT